MIRAESLGKIYPDGTCGLKDLDLKVGPGEIYCLLGANGAGKTTAINLFLNFIEPTSGRCFINGVDASREPLEAKRYVAYLSENVMLYGNFTARANLDFFARVSGRKGASREEYDRLMDRVGLPTDAFGRRVRTFSKGMRQKLGIAIAIIKDAPCLLLDEPLSGLDPKAAAELVALLNELRDQGKAILMSTHDVFRARNLADKVGIMKAGIKVVEQDRQELANSDLERIYLRYMNAVDEPRSVGAPE